MGHGGSDARHDSRPRPQPALPPTRPFISSARHARCGSRPREPGSRSRGRVPGRVAVLLDGSAPPPFIAIIFKTLVRITNVALSKWQGGAMTDHENGPVAHGGPVVSPADPRRHRGARRRAVLGRLRAQARPGPQSARDRTGVHRGASPPRPGHRRARRRRSGRCGRVPARRARADRRRHTRRTGDLRIVPRAAEAAAPGPARADPGGTRAGDGRHRREPGVPGARHREPAADGGRGGGRRPRLAGASGWTSST